MSRVLLNRHVFILGTEICWLYAMVALFGMLFGNGGPALSFPYVAILLVLAYSIAYLLEQLEFSVRVLRLIGGAAAALIILNVASIQVNGVPSLLGIGWLWSPPNPGIDFIVYRRAVMLALGFGALLWWRGVKLTQRRNTISAVLFSMRLGLVIIAIEALIELMVVPQERASWVAVPFFALSLWTLVLTREQESGSGSQGNGLTVAGSAVVILVAAGMVLGLLPFAVLGGPASRAGNVVGDLVSAILAIVLFPLVLLMEALVFLIRAILSNMKLHNLDNILDNLPESPLDAVQELVKDGSLIPPFVGTMIKLTLVAALIIIVLLWLSRALRKRRAAREAEALEERESLWSESDLMGDLKELMLGFLSSRKDREAGQPWYGEGLGRGPRRAVLRVYYSLLNLSSNRGMGRPPSQTPREYLGTLYYLYPINRRETETITDVFTKARYSPQDPEESEVSQVHEAWNRIQKPGENT